jgi:hypothetical protein
VTRQPAIARRLFDRFEPIHAVTYFAPECRNAYDALGLRGFWMGYFAARSAPFGTVGAEVVTAVFYNFARSHVERALPDAWEYASPAQILRAREASAVAALQRYGVSDDETVCAAAELLATAARTAPLDGRPLFAANLALPWPTEPVAKVWHAATLLREQRGDSHVAVLSAATATSCIRWPTGCRANSSLAVGNTTTTSGTDAAPASRRAAWSTKPER